MGGYELTVRQAPPGGEVQDKKHWFKINGSLSASGVMVLRRVVSGAGFSSANDLTQAVGTVYCDGGVRGTASHVSLVGKPSLKPSIILTAAHILYDKQTGQPFKACHYRPNNKRLSSMAFQQISAHDYSINSENKIPQAENDLVFIQPKNHS